jgi:hypothetical protein
MRHKKSRARPDAALARRLRPAALAWAAMVSATCVHAARPMATDDARIVDDKACQLESWVKSRRDSTEYWAQPACNFTGNLELTLGAARTREGQATRNSDQLIQGKTLFKALEPNGWGWGLAMGHARHPSANGSGDYYAYVPVSLSTRDDRLVFHTNIGWLREQETRSHRMTWGLATEAQLSASAWLIAETYGQNRGRPFYQMGLRYWIVPNHVQLDATYGNRAGSSTQERWFSIGLRLLSSPFLP